MGVEKRTPRKPESGTQGGGQTLDATDILNQDNESGKTFAGMTDEEFKKCAATERLKAARERKDPFALVKPFSEIVAVAITWLWLFKIAIGKFTLFAGDPGLGKSQGTLDIAARASLGKPFPDGSPCPLGDTIILTSEDDPADTIRPRLDALEADVKRIHILQGERLADGNVKSMDMKKVGTLKDAIYQIEAKGHNFLLLVIDPVDSFLGGSDSNSNEEVREALDGLCALAERQKFAVLGIKHLNKSKNDPAYRVGGSIAFTAKARAVWVFTEDKKTGRHLFLPLKNNLGPSGGGFQYSIQVRDTGGITAPFISWEGQADDDIKDVLNPYVQFRERAAPEQEAALEVLQEAGNSMTTGEIAEALGKTPQGTYNVLKKLEKKGKITSPKYGHWEVTSVTSVTSIKPPSVSGLSKVTPPHLSSVSDVSSVTSPVSTPEGKPTVPSGSETGPEIW
ncbi:MAG: AAA family ATPase [Treponema sp.]|nr:AAA family ATPase [Treponema sp.]